jgi:hypothetical protein
VRGVAGDVDDQPAAFGQQRNRQLDQSDGCADVDGEDPPETRHVELQERADASELRSVVHDQVQAAERARSIHHSRPH